MRGWRGQTNHYWIEMAMFYLLPAELDDLMAARSRMIIRNRLLTGKLQKQTLEAQATGLFRTNEGQG